MAKILLSCSIHTLMFYLKGRSVGRHREGRFVTFSSLRRPRSKIGANEGDVDDIKRQTFELGVSICMDSRPSEDTNDLDYSALVRGR